MLHQTRHTVAFTVTAMTSAASPEVWQVKERLLKLVLDCAADGNLPKMHIPLTFRCMVAALRYCDNSDAQIITVMVPLPQDDAIALAAWHCLGSVASSNSLTGPNPKYIVPTLAEPRRSRHAAWADIPGQPVQQVPMQMLLQTLCLSMNAV